jgi:hypothetical protein
MEFPESHQIQGNADSAADERASRCAARAADQRTRKAACTRAIDEGTHRTFAFNFKHLFHGQFTHSLFLI